MKMRKNIVLLSITIITLIGLVAIATYSYFTASVNANNKITTNVKMPLRPTFIVSGGGEMTITIDRNLTLKENVYNGTHEDGINTKTVLKNLSVTLTGEPGTSCTYNIYYKDTSTNGSYVYSRTGSSAEIEIYLIRNSVAIAAYDYIYISQTSVNTSKITPLLGGSTAPFNIAKPVITVPSDSTSVTDNWIFQWNFYNRNWDQSALADKKFKGEFYIVDVVCT